MSQNRSSAVMQQRSEPHDSLDDFPTPPWATRALCEWLRQIHRIDSMVCREPTANRGHMVAPLREFFAAVLPSDVHDYGASFPQCDYLFGADNDLPETEFTVFNPPFKLAEQFIAKALRLSRIGVCAIVRSAFLEGVGRHERLFKDTPPSHILQFTERVVMHKGRLAPEGSTATAYCWLVWLKPVQLTKLHWIAPCRKRLERAEDYV